MQVVEINAAEANLGDVDMLIGMAVIVLGDFTVQNDNGKTHYSFSLPPFENKYDMLEKANQINHRNAKYNAKQQAKMLKGEA